MNTKLFEIRDSGTFIPVMATLMLPSAEPELGELVAAEYREARDAECYLLRRAGYGFEKPLVMVCRLEQSGFRQAAYDCYEWGQQCRTMMIAHQWIEGHWPELNSGDVIDVEFILEETKVKKRSERVTDHHYDPHPSRMD